MVPANQIVHTPTGGGDRCMIGEHDWAQLRKGNDSVRERIMTEYLPLVKNVAGRMARTVEEPIATAGPAGVQHVEDGWVC